MAENVKKTVKHVICTPNKFELPEITENDALVFWDLIKLIQSDYICFGFEPSIKLLNEKKIKAFLISSDFNPCILAKQIISMIYKQHKEVYVLVIPDMYTETKKHLGGTGFTVISIKFHNLMTDDNYNYLSKWMGENHCKFINGTDDDSLTRNFSVSRYSTSNLYAPLRIHKVQNNPNRVKKNLNPKMKGNTNLKKMKQESKNKNLKKINENKIKKKINCH